jgi:hypothetical protein
MSKRLRQVWLLGILLAGAILFGSDSNYRQMKYSTRSSREAVRWQRDVRTALLGLLKMEDLASRKRPLHFETKILGEEDKTAYHLLELEIHSTSTRKVPVILTIPNKKRGPFPAVVCIHGHGGTRYSVYDRSSIYKGFAAALAESGFVTIAADVGQHEVYENGRTLMGERLWDLMRCVDLLFSLEKEVDSERIGCAGLSLGGEMAMWLGAMDSRVSAVFSSGFLTVMDQMEQNHCMCWKFDGLREFVDFADIYSLIAPRALMCQNGLLEGPNDFYVPIARKAMEEIMVIYKNFKKPQDASLNVHQGGHEIHLPGLINFFHKNLAFRDDPMKFIDNKEKGLLTVRKDQVDVLTYRYGDQLKEGVDPEQTRSCYIHPLYSLGGQVLTDDFPEDHLHHHGVFWTWPIVKTRDQLTQTWHPHSPSLRQHFVRWLKREKKNDMAIISTENVWKLNDREVVAKEIVTLHIHPADNISRALDLKLQIQAVGGPLTLQGTLDQNKGYGGLSIRGAPMFTGATMCTDRGMLEEDSTNVPFFWADLSTEELGMAIFVSPDHPDFPITWLIRNSYAGFLNASWPGLEPTTLEPDVQVTLQYRIYIHKGDTTTGKVREAYKQYLSLFPKK